MQRLKILNPRFLVWLLRTRKLRLRLRKKKSVILKDYVKIDKCTLLEGMNLLQHGVALKNSKIGLGTYISSNSKFIDTLIGRYCSIGQNVKNGFALHPTKDFVSTHPAFYSTRRQAGFTYVNEAKFEEHKFLDKNLSIRLMIGNDVWIGHDVLIMDGIKIGDGAIIGAGAVVTKDIDPYTIVGGVPAKVIRKRFNDEQIEYLLNIKWWDKDQKWISENKELFISIDKMMNYHK